jgi:hypothetical protein
MSVPPTIALIRSRDSGKLTTAGRLAPANAIAPTALAAAPLPMLTSPNPRTAGPPWTTPDAASPGPLPGPGRRRTSSRR